MIGDNRSTKDKVSDLMCARFVGCSSHRFNRTVEENFKRHDQLLMKVRTVMKQLPSRIAAAKLSILTGLQAKFYNVTFWASAVQMLERYVKLKEYI